MAKEVPSKYSLAKNIIILLDVIIALLIIIGSRYLIKTPLGKAGLAFGFIMICIVTVLKLSEKL